MEVLTRIIQFLPQINQHGLDIVVVNIIYLAVWIIERAWPGITCINFWHIVCITTWFQGTHNMFGFYTAFVVNVIKCRSKYKKYSKRILTSKTGKVRQRPGIARVNIGSRNFVTPNHSGLYLTLLVSPPQSKHWFFVFWSLPISQSLWRKIFCKFTRVATGKLCLLVVEISKWVEMCCFFSAHFDTFELDWIEGEETSYLVLDDSISTMAILAF